MRFFLCLIGSILLHLLVVQCWGFQIDARSQNAGRQLLTVRLTQSSQLVPEPVVHSALPVQSMPSGHTAQEINHEQIQHEIGADKQVTNRSPHPSEETLYSGFLPTSELDRKAQPISNINLDMMQGISSSGLNIRLRLYINEYGRVVHVEELMVLEQDREFKDKLVALLFDLTFLPAKKNGVTVSSYQDVSLNFNPILNQPLEPASN